MSNIISQETKELIISLWQKGKSGTDIAHQIGSTRNAVIGLINRERKKGVDLRGSDKIVNVSRKPRPKRIVSFFEKRLPAEKRQNIMLHELTPTSCRFIVSGEGASALFCGSKKEFRSYCAKHASICYVYDSRKRS